MSRGDRSRPGPHVWAILPAGLVLGALAAYPTLYLLWLSLSAFTPQHPTPSFIGLRHFIDLFFNDAFFWKSFGLTFLFLGAALLVELALGLSLALILVGRPRPSGAAPGRLAWLRTLLSIPMTLTPVVVGLSWRILFDPDLGLLNTILAAVGILGPAWVADPRTALLSLVLVDVWQWTPFMVLVLGASLAQQPRDLYEAAAIDGAGAFATFWHVTLPGLRRALAAATLLRSIDLFRAFDVIFIITEGGPGTATETLSLYAYRVLRRFDIGYASAIGLVLLLITLLGSRLFARILGEPRERRLHGG